jgi:hypothetical protein
MQVVIKQEIKSSYTGQVLRVQKMINPELCVDTISIARASALGAKETNDCVVRAFMAALDVTYEVAHSWVAKKLHRQNRRGTYTSTFLYNVLGKTKNGKKIQMYGASPSHFWMYKGVNIITNPKYKKPTGYTIASFIENHPVGRFVVIVEGHAVAVVDGKFYANRNEGAYHINRRVHYVIECK